MINRKYIAIFAAFSLVFALGCGDDSSNSGASNGDPAGNSTANTNGKIDDGFQSVQRHFCLELLQVPRSQPP